VPRGIKKNQQQRLQLVAAFAVAQASQQQSTPLPWLV
jgi:hypothetical protein